MTNISTGKAFTRRDFGKGLAAIFAAGVAPALLGQTARGLMHRNLGGRIATGGGGGKKKNYVKFKLTNPSSLSVYVGTLSNSTSYSGTVVNWGDGTTSQLYVGYKDFTRYGASHTYESTGEYVVTAMNDAIIASGSRNAYCTEIYWNENTLDIPDNAFIGCSSLKLIGDLSRCPTIGQYAFTQCTSLENVSELSSCVNLCSDAFNQCSSLRAIGNLPVCTKIGNACFYGCSSLSSIGDMPICTTIGASAIRSCPALISVGDLSSCSTIGQFCFSSTSLISSISFLNKTHTEVEAITGFSNFPNRGTACVFHCSDGDFYRSGSSLLPMP